MGATDKKALKQVFPNVEPTYRRSAAIQTIAYHAAQHGMKALSENAARVAFQPWREVESLIEIDFTTREVTVIPGIHGRWSKWSYTLSEGKMTEFIGLLDAPSLLALPAENELIGPDGATLFLESNRAGKYRWFAYWGGEHPTALQKPFTFLRVETVRVESQRRTFESNTAGTRPVIHFKQGRNLHRSIELPKTPLPADVENGLRNAQWNKDQTAAVIIIPHSEGSIIVAFVESSDHRWVAHDISRVERQNLGKLGESASELQSIATEVTHWIPRNDGLLQVALKTRATDAHGKALSAEEPLIINRNTGPRFR